MKKKLYLDQMPTKFFFNGHCYKVFFNGLIINSHEFLERFFTHTTLSHYTHDQINSGTKIKKMEGDS